MLSQGGSLSGLLPPDHLLVFVIAFSILGVTASIPFRKTIYKTVNLAAVVVLIAAGGIVWNHITETAHLKKVSAAEEVEFVDGIQVVNSTLSSGRYPNITVQAGTPVKWVIDAPAGSINGCNYKMLLKAFGIEHSFQEGKNIIEFTPAKAGTYTYTCWMGMIRGNIFVTDGNNVSSPAGGKVSDVPIPSGYKIPSEKLAIAELTTDEYGNIVQEVTIELTDEGFSPAVVVLQSYIQTIWHINVNLSDAQNETAILAPIYSTILNLSQGDNELFLYPSESFEISTGDNAFYAYVKAVDNINQIDTAAIQKEVDEFETLIYPASVFESAGAGGSCCQ